MENKIKMVDKKIEELDFIYKFSDLKADFTQTLD